MKVTADDVAQLLASAPPRKVALNVAKEVMGRGTPWFLVLFGLLFGGMGLMFTWMFFPWRIRDDWRLAADAARTVPGVITEVSRTSMSINDTHVMEYGFSFTAEDGRQRVGRCFTTGERWDNQAEVTVRYLPEQPDLACVEGARLSEGGVGGAFVLIFPLVGGGIIAWFVVDRKQKRRLLHEGLVTEANVVSVEETNTRVNNQYVYKITLTSPDLKGGQPVTISRVNRADIHLALRHAHEKQPVFILYDPRNHARLIFPEALLEPEPGT